MEIRFIHKRTLAYVSHRLSSLASMTAFKNIGGVAVQIQMLDPEIRSKTSVRGGVRHTDQSSTSSSMG